MSNPFDEFDEPSPSLIAPPIAAAASNPFDEFDDGPEPSGLFRRAVADTGVSLAKGVVGLGEAAVGLADIPTLGRAGKALEEIAGYDPKSTQGFLEGLYSPEQQAANRAVGEAEGVGGTLSALAENPSVIPHKLVETLPLLGGGAAFARALPAGMSALARGAAGEGTLAAGSSAEHIRQASETGTLSPEQTALAATSGAVTGLITRGSGALANRLGIGDVEQLLAGGGPAAATGKGRVRRGFEGAVTEGLLEEAPQSAQEQALQNLALDKPVLEGVPEAATLGGVIGSVMGGGVAALPAAPRETILPAPATGAGAEGVAAPPIGSPTPPPSPSRGEGEEEAAPVPVGADPRVRPAEDVGLADLDPEQRRHMEAIGGQGPLTAAAAAGGLPSSTPASATARGTPASGSIEEEPAATGGLPAPASRSAPAGPSRRSRGSLSPLGAREAERARVDIAAEQVRTAELARRGPLGRAVARGAEFAGPDLVSATATTLGDVDPGQGPNGESAFAPTAGAPLTSRSSERPPRAGNIVPADLLSATTGPALGAIDQAAHQAATSPQNDLPQPTDPQRKAGNYPKGHLRYAGLDISIENPRGSKRSGIDPKGKPWEVEMSAHYGYIRSTEGNDGEQVDVYLASDREDTPAFVVDQVDPKTGRFDEHKVVLGAESREEAEATYDAHFSDGSGPGRRKDTTGMSMDEFKAWLKEGDTKKPLAKQKPARATTAAPTPSNTPTDTPTLPAGASPGRSQEGGLSPRIRRSRNGGDGRSAAVNDASVAKPRSATPIHDGAPTTATTPKGQAVDLRYGLVEAADLVVSHDLEGTPNPAYPKHLQPRDRSRQASTLQIQRIAGNLAPERLTASATVSDGAPVVGPDQAVESGNGRVLAIRKAYGGEKGKAYREYLKKNAASFGVEETDIDGMTAPVLVRTRTTNMSDAERAAFARDANESTTARMSPAEEARADAARIGTALEDYLPSEDGNVLAMQNRGFVKRFLGGLAPEEAAAVTTGEGAPTKQLGERIRAAVFFAAYRDERLLSLFAEEADPEIRTVIAALNRAAPEFARARGLSDTLGPYNVIPAIVEAADIIRQARQSNQAVEEAVSQQGLFGAQDPNAQAIALFMDQNKRSAKRLGEGLRAMAGFIEGELAKAENLALFAETPPTLGEVIARVNEYIQERYGQENAINQDLFSQPRRDAPIASASAEGGKPEEGDRAGAEGAEEAKPVTPAYGAANKVFTADAAAAARERLRKKLGTVRIGLDPEMYQDGMTLAGYHIEAGARKFADFSKAMIADLGEKARPYLRKWFNAVKDNQGFDFGAASTAAEAAEERSPAKEAPPEVRPAPQAPTEAEVDAELAKDSAALEEERNRPGRIEHMVVEKAKRELAAGRIDQDAYDRVVEKYGAAASQYTLQKPAAKEKASKPTTGEEPTAKPAEPEAQPKKAGAKEKPTKPIEDVGEKIGGARKDLWRERGLRLADLEGMSGGEEAQYVTKENVWPAIDYPKLIADGATPQAAALIKIIRDRLAKSPKKDTPEGRRHYVEMIGIAREELEKAKTADEVKAVGNAVFIRIGWYKESGWRDDAVRAKAFSVYQGRSNPFSLNWADTRKADKMIAEGWPAKKAKTKTQAAREEGKLPERPHLDDVQRTGEDRREGRDVTGEDFLKEFGFRGVEHGLWAAQDERQKALNLAYEALHDLAGTLGVPPKALSLNGTLGLAFGARGSGQFAAHYEPGKLVINLTKLRGAGTLAHEWGHGLDHYFGELDRPDAYQGGARGATGWMGKGRRVKRENLRPEMAAAFDGVMKAIFEREVDQAEAVRQAELRLENLQGEIAKGEQRVTKAEQAEHPDKDWLKRMRAWLDDARRSETNAKATLAELRNEPRRIGGYGKVASSYLKEASKLAGSGDYWTRPTELFARAFEAYVFDRIGEQGQVSQYLVQGVEPERYGSSDYKGNPYPVGLERDAINAAFEKLFAAMQTRETEKGAALYSRSAESSFGQAEGLFEKPDVPVTEISGAELTTGKALWQLRHAARQHLKTYQGQSFRNADTGWELRVSKDSVLKMSSQSQAEDDLRAVAALPALIEHAVLAESHADSGGSIDIAAIHRLYAPLGIAGQLYRVKLTIKEGTEVGRKIYTLASARIGDPAVIKPATTTQMSGAHERPAGSALSIADLLRGAVRDSDGQPFAAQDAGERYSRVRLDLYGGKIEKAPNLTAKEREVEARFAEKILGDVEGAIVWYRKTWGNVINTDNARDYSEDYNASLDSRSILAAAVHEPSSWLVKQVWQRMLAEPKPADKTDTVVFSAGGTGAGKTTAIESIPTIDRIAADAHIVYDSNMNDLAKAKARIDQVIAAGKDVEIFYVYRDPIEAMENGALSRAMRQGRTAPINEHAKTHIGAARVIPKLAQHYAHDLRVEFAAIDNSRGKGGAVETHLDFGTTIEHNENTLREKLYATVKEARDTGRISEAVYIGTVGEYAGRGSGEISGVAPAEGATQAPLRFPGARPERQGTPERPRLSPHTPKQKPGPAGLSASGLVETLVGRFGGGVRRLIKAKTLGIVQHESELPARLNGGRGRIRGVYDPRTETTWLVAEQLTAADAPGVFLHEVGVHYGLERMVGAEKYQDIIGQVKRMEADGNVAALAARAAIPKSTPKAAVDDELLAYLVEKHPELPIVKRIVAAIRAFLFRMGLIKNIRPDDVVALAKAAAKHAARGTPSYLPLRKGEEKGEDGGRGGPSLPLQKGGLEGVAPAYSGSPRYDGQVGPRLIEVNGVKYLPVRVRRVEWGMEQRFVVGPNGQVTLETPSPGVADGTDPALRESLSDALDKQFAPDFGEDVYFRYTNNKDELRLANSGALRPSRDQRDQALEKGVSVSRNPAYGVLGHYQYGYKLTGKVVGSGMDGEPVLDPKSIKALQRRMSTSEAMNGSYARQRDAAIERGVRKLGWTMEQYQAARQSAVFSIPIEGKLFNWARVTADDLGLDPTNSDIRYSRKPPEGSEPPPTVTGSEQGSGPPDPNTPEGSAEALSRIGEAMRTTRHGWEAVKSKIVEDWRPARLAVLTRRQLVDIGQGMVPELADYDRAVQAMDADRNQLDGETHEVAEIAEAYVQANPKEADDFFDLLHAATLAGVDPADKFRASINRGEAFAEMASLRRRMRTRPGEADVLQGQIDEILIHLANEKVRKSAHPGLARRWFRLSQDAKVVYARMRDLYKKRFDEREAALIQRIRDTEADERWKARLIVDIKHRFETARLSAPYFPLTRFGDFWVAAVNPNGEREFHLRESAHQMKALAEDLARAGYHDIASGRKIDTLFEQQGASAEFVTEVIKLLDRGTHISHAARADLKDAIYQMYLQSLPELSTRRHWIHRKKTPGFSKDAVRGFAKHMFHGNRQLAVLRQQTPMEKALAAARKREKFGSDPAHEPMEQALRDMRKVKKDKADPEFVALEKALATARKAVKDKLDPVRTADLINEMQKRDRWIKNPQVSSFAYRAGSLGFLWYLTAPASAIVNVTQTPLVAYPLMAARHGWVKSAAALNRAAVDFFKGRFSVEGALQGEELAAYKRFLADAVIDKTQTHDLAGMAETPSGSYSGRGAKAMRYASWMFHRAEVMNREVTALAAYRLARADGLGIEAAYQQAKTLTVEAHFDYSAGNKPRFLQNDAARVFLMFKQFSQHMIYLLGRSAHQSVKGLTPAARSEARTRLTGLLGMHALFAGALGMPLTWHLSVVMNALFDDEDEPWDFETEFRNFLAEAFGPEIGQAIARGPVESLTGLGIASRVGLSDLVFREPDKSLEGRGLVEWWSEQLLGPLGGIALKAGTAYDLFQDGHTMRALESMTPTAIRSGLQMLRYAGEGAQSLRGDAVMEDVSTWNLFWQATGFSPAKLGQKYDANRALKDLEQRTNDRHDRLIGRWWLARRHGDLEGVREAMAAIGRFNASSIIRENPRKRITPATLLASMQSRRNYSRRAEGGIIVDRRLSRLEERVRFGG